MVTARIGVLATACTAGVCQAALALSAGSSVRPVTVRDGIEMSVAADPTCGAVASFSPDGKEFVVVVSRGDLQRNVNRYTMVLWNTADVGSGRQRTILQMSSSSYFPAIDASSIVWSPDGRTLTFLGEHPGEHQQVYRLDLRTGGLQRLTHHPTDVLTYGLDASGQVLAFEALPQSKSLWTAATANHGLAVTTQGVADLMSGQEAIGAQSDDRRLFVRDSHGEREIQPTAGSEFTGDALERNWNSVSVSPNGLYLVTVEGVPFRDIPAAWHEYRSFGAQLTFEVVGKQKRLAVKVISQYVLVNLRSGRTRVLLNAPIFGVATRPVIWTPDSRSVIVNQTLLPLGGKSSGEPPRDASVPATVEVSIDTKAVTSIGRRCNLAVSWRDDALTCTATPDSEEVELAQYTKQTYFKKASLIEADSCHAAELTGFRRVGGMWRETNRPAPPEVSVFLKEAMNFPAQLYYKRRGQKKGRMLLDLNPQFKQLRFARERLVTWDWSKDQSVTGGLYYPVDYRPGTRYPLVIQTHGLDAAHFDFFGSMPTAFAAQPLAARNMFVLQLPETRLMEKRGWQIYEVEAAAKIYRSAIAYLSNLGLIDPRKVGVIGFSRTCLYVKWSLVHHPELFAAASVTQGVDDGYLQYLVGLGDDSVTGLYGGAPFGGHLRTWMNLSPGFNMDVVRAPLMIAVPDYRTVLYDWEWFKGLQELGKPVYMLLFDGRVRDTHLLQVPRDRWLSSQGNVDWFDFWLNGHEGPGAVDVHEYSRWEELCKTQKQQQSAVATFCVSSGRPKTNQGGADRAKTAHGR